MAKNDGYRAMLRLYVLRPAGRRPVMQSLMAAVIVLAATRGPALAGQSTPGVNLSDAAPLLPPPTASGRPMTFTPQATPLDRSDAGRCPPRLPCGTRLLGSVRKDGTIELQVPAFRW